MRKARVQRLDGKKVDVVLHLGNVFICSHGLCCGKAECGYGPDLRELHEEWDAASPLPSGKGEASYLLD